LFLTKNSSALRHCFTHKVMTGKRVYILQLSISTVQFWTSIG